MAGRGADRYRPDRLLVRAAADPEVAPDVVTLAKGLGGGLPIGACIGFGHAGDLLQPGHHGTTFGGNPVACAAALAVLDTIVRRGTARPRAPGWATGSRAGVAAHPQVTEVRGRGTPHRHRRRDVDAARVVAAARSHGFIVNATRSAHGEAGPAPGPRRR